MDKKANLIKVLLVDDQPIVRKGLEMRLSLEEDIEVIGAAGDGKQALEFVRKQKPQVVIMDYAMPVMDGLQATVELSEKYPDVTVIILSIEDNPCLHAQAIEAGAKAFVAKRQGTDKLLLEIRGSKGS
jgi:DNA-binding NarL/FixJ family response regulator